MPLTIDIDTFNESVDNRDNVSGAQTLDLSQSSNFDLLLSGDVSLSVTNASQTPAGNSFTVKLTQDGTGGHSITGYPSGTIWTDGVDHTVDGGANTTDVITFATFDGGSTWIAMVAATGAE